MAKKLYAFRIKEELYNQITTDNKTAFLELAIEDALIKYKNFLPK